MTKSKTDSKPKVVLILQARMGSVRLPGKSMMDLLGVPLLGRIIERVKYCEKPDKIVVATSTLPQDDVLVGLAEKYDVPCFRGSENDVLDRYYQAAKIYDADIVVRLPADNATPEPSEIGRIIDYHIASGNAYSSNLAEVLGNGYPDGIGAEAISFWALEKVWHECTDLRMREHLHLNFFDYETQAVKNPEVYKVGTIECPEEYRRPDLVLDVNTLDEYHFICQLYDYLYPRNPQFHITDTLKWYDEIYLPGQATRQSK